MKMVAITVKPFRGTVRSSSLFHLHARNCRVNVFVMKLHTRRITSVFIIVISKFSSLRRDGRRLINSIPHRSSDKFHGSVRSALPITKENVKKLQSDHQLWRLYEKIQGEGNKWQRVYENKGTRGVANDSLYGWKTVLFIRAGICFFVKRNRWISFYQQRYRNILYVTMYNFFFWIRKKKREKEIYWRKNWFFSQ